MPAAMACLPPLRGPQVQPPPELSCSSALMSEVLQACYTVLTCFITAKLLACLSHLPTASRLNEVDASPCTPPNSFRLLMLSSNRSLHHCCYAGESTPSSRLCCARAGNGNASSNDGSLAACDATLVLEGKQFRDFVVGPGGFIDRAAFSAIWPRLRVLARCSPQDKYTIVSGELFSAWPIPRSCVRQALGAVACTCWMVGLRGLAWDEPLPAQCCKNMCPQMCAALRHAYSTGVAARQGAMCVCILVS